ncbi:unnamed protein product [Ambrosiozyma monospora]|uniref:Unnamed protein product n=1 Tax=Ambrosiozyma monospora TaxID=43982 RepID=A0A9W6YYK3_AMBMO|nr:unnamed protein product [Ambrosiozyma monospora]
MMQNTFPRLPFSESVQSLAIHVMTVIGNINYETSPTLTVHIFPLFIAGCEVHSEIDRDWFRNQFKKLYNMIWCANIKKLTLVMEEVWKRKTKLIQVMKTTGLPFTVDDYQINGLRSKPNWYQVVKEKNMEIFLG